jgi:hypothetical protein
MNKLKAFTVTIDSLSETDIFKMYELFSTYYKNTKLGKFKNDLILKDRVILLLDRKNKHICGFSTLKILKTNVNGKQVKALYSGDTILDNNYWGQTALTMEFFKNLVREKFKDPLLPFYWFLISKGFKTYLLLTNNFYNFYPRFDKATPSFESELLDSLSLELFGSAYQQSSKTLCFGSETDSLKEKVAPLTRKALDNPHVSFFSDSNPNWQDGEELCCLGKVDLGLALKYLIRTYKKRFKR